jgi:hypothetical protein
MIHGYARVSTTDQDAALQHSALTEAGCDRLYTDQASGGRWDRPELHRLLVWNLDVSPVPRRLPRTSEACESQGLNR